MVRLVCGSVLPRSSAGHRLVTVPGVGEEYWTGFPVDRWLTLGHLPPLTSLFLFGLFALDSAAVWMRASVDSFRVLFEHGFFNNSSRTAQ